ncbi:MAG TPA: hypothetical protein ENN74_00615, partial [Firmicutes bacterium]|nr:hypothetical protein [Bacillota bacterium]
TEEEFKERFRQALYTRHRGGRVEDLFVLEGVGGVMHGNANALMIDRDFFDSASVTAGIPLARASSMMGGTGIRFKAGEIPAAARLGALGYLGDRGQRRVAHEMPFQDWDFEPADQKENISGLGYYGHRVSELDEYTVDELKPKSTEVALRTGDVGKPEQVEQPRVRSWFPETLLSEPAVITDENGVGRRRVAIADSITTWRLTGQANTLDGEVGSTTSALRVFQEFFVDIDLPVALTQGDEVTLPVVVYNYLKEDQEVRLALQKEDWFELLEGSYERTLEVQADSVDSSPYRILVKDIGPCSLTVYGYGASKSDAVMRTVQVKPNGKEVLESTSDRLDRFVDQTLVIPAEALDGASKILLKIYPGLFSQVLEGMDSILRMPSGCFEQTSSTTYPNLLVLDYMRHTNQINPEIEMRAKQYINLGYQRLFSYEVPGGGFQAFGNPPANRVLTAYGLQQFFDMAKVHPVDPALIPRTQEWLAGQQNADGSWTPDDNYVHAEMWQGIQNSNLVATAYIVEGLTSSGYRGEALDKAMGYLRKHAGEAKDAFSLVHLAAALVGIDPDDELTSDVLKQLRDLAKETKDEAYWESQATFSFACGDVASIEVTAHAALAMMQAGKYPELTGKVLNWLLRKKDPSGTWNSTQATVLAMKTFLAALEKQTETADGKVLVKINDEEYAPMVITPETSDVLRMLDLGPSTVKGGNRIHIALQGEGSLLYQLVAKYYLPWEEEEKLQEPLTIKVDYDRTELQKDDTVTCKVEVQNNQPMIANMVMVDVGIPPGFKVESEELEAYVARRAIEKYNITGRQLTLYLEKLDPGRPARYEVKMKARFPLRAKTPESRVYQYYNPEILGMAEPIDMVVKG